MTVLAIYLFLSLYDNTLVSLLIIYLIPSTYIIRFSVCRSPVSMAITCWEPGLTLPFHAGIILSGVEVSPSAVLNLLMFDAFSTMPPQCLGFRYMSLYKRS
jgi:hypothetical protein